MKTKLGYFIIALALLASLAQTMRAAVVFTITPSAISNTYNGPITLSVTGLTNTETVVVQKFLDANTNNVIDAGDILWQQFNLSDGTNFVIGGVTNINVPGDSDGTANGQITAKLNFQADFAQTVVGKYLFKLSSPGGHFTPITNSFTVTNFPFAQKFTGTVASSGVAVPNAVILLFQGSGSSVGGDGASPVGGAVANNSGSYNIQAAPGTYLLAAFKTNFIADTTAAAGLALGGGATISTNLSLLAATRSITGKFVASTSSSIGLPGLLVPFLTQNGLLAVYFTDTNGNFTARVNASQWQVQNNTAAIVFEGYVAPQNGTVADTTAGNVSLANIQLHKGTALFFGTVKDNFGNPLPMVVPVGASDNNNGLYDTDGYTDANGNYVTAVVGGLGSSDPWSASIDNSSSFPNYVFSQSALSQNGGTNMTSGKVVQQNFTAILATHHITGHVQFTNAPVAGVQVNAEATINGVDYNSQMDTDSSGNYSLNVPNGDWNVTLFDCCDNDSLDNLLGSGNYVPPGNVDVIINNNNGTANFTVLPNGAGQIFGSVTDTDGDPVIGVTVSANDGVGDNFSTSTDGSGSYSFNVANGNWDVSVDCDGLTSLGYQCVSDQNVNVSGGSVEQDFNVQFNNPPLQITTTSLPNGTNGLFYTQTLQASGGTPPYSWSLALGSANPPPNLTLAPSGALSGTISTTTGTYFFDVLVTDAALNTAELDALPLTVVNPPSPPLIITNVSLPNGNIGAAYSAQLGATGGQSPYNWSLALGSANPPPGLLLNSSGVISGIPTTNGLFNFKAQAIDATITVTNKVFGIIINPKPVLDLPARLASQFQMRLTGASNQNYTVQVSTNLGSSFWTSLFVTNSPTTNAFIVTDPNATNNQRFYRILIGP